MARLRLVGTAAARADAEVPAKFIIDNIRTVPPIDRTADPSGWGEAAKGGAPAITAEAVRLARAFADRAHGEVVRSRHSRWAANSLPLNRTNPAQSPIK
jgi:hypothetical protein